MPQSYRSLKMWQVAHEWVLEVYRLTRVFPRDEKFALADQLRRSASSVAMNIAEGYGRRGITDKLRFYNIAEASLNEADYQLLLAQDLGYARTDALQTTAEEIMRMLTTYMRRLRESS